MSAFTVSEEHINTIVNAGLRLPYGDVLRWKGPDDAWVELTGATADRVGNMLWQTNFRSVNYRYEEDELEPVYNYRPLARQIHPLAALKAIKCYRYQSCEHPEWEGSEADRFTDSLIYSLIGALPGYSTLPWVIGSDEEIIYL
ncbi:hypothetical protein ACWDTT_15970 [Streptosporangium sandarakinum]